MKMMPLKKVRIQIHVLAFSACFFAAIGDFVVTFLLGAYYPGYNFIYHSESHLGTADSPVAFFMNLWGVLFCLLLLTFAWGLNKTILQYGRWQKIIVWCLVLYGIGEGAGSGLFPYDHVKNVLSFSGELHSFFGAIGGTAIAIIPFASSKIFSKKDSPILNAYCWLTFFSGLFCITLFLLAKENLIPYKGLLQRIFILDYHIFLLVLGTIMLKTRVNHTESGNA